jgi:hypothetical protein
MSTTGSLRNSYERAAALVALSTLLLTASFVGFFAFVTGRVVGVGGRVPAYVLVMSAAFVATIFTLTKYGADGRTVIFAAGGTAVLSLLLSTFAGEGVVYALAHPNAVFGSQLVAYFLAAGLAGTGLSFWAIHYWRDFAVSEVSEVPEGEASTDAE